MTVIAVVEGLRGLSAMSPLVRRAAGTIVRVAASQIVLHAYLQRRQVLQVRRRSAFQIVRLLFIFVLFLLLAITSCLVPGSLAGEIVVNRDQRAHAVAEHLVLLGELPRRVDDLDLVAFLANVAETGNYDDGLRRLGLSRQLSLATATAAAISEPRPRLFLFFVIIFVVVLVHVVTAFVGSNLFTHFGLLGALFAPI